MTTLLHLRKDEERRLRTGHVWIYSNEIDITRSPLRGLEPGQAVEVMSSRGQWLGHGYVNPNTLIAARIVSRDREHPLDRSLIVHFGFSRTAAVIAQGGEMLFVKYIDIGGSHLDASIARHLKIGNKHIYSC